MGLKFNKASQSGFTIVELLIVVVVIAILAAITIVSYNGITTRANHSAAQSTASTVQKKAELYYSVEGTYPTAIDDFNEPSESYHLTSDSMSLTDPNAVSGKNTVKVDFCGTGDGMTIEHWDYEGAADMPGSPQITLGNTADCS